MHQPFRFVLRSDPACQTPIPFIYFHGKLEDAVDAHQKSMESMGWEWGAPDLVGVDSPNGVSDATLLGITDHEVYGVPARAFLWRVTGSLRGLIVAQSDEESLAYAEKKFKAQAALL